MSFEVAFAVVVVVVVVVVITALSRLCSEDFGKQAASVCRVLLWSTNVQK